MIRTRLEQCLANPFTGRRRTTISEPRYLSPQKQLEQKTINDHAHYLLGAYSNRSLINCVFSEVLFQLHKSTAERETREGTRPRKEASLTGGNRRDARVSIHVLVFIHESRTAYCCCCCCCCCCCSCSCSCSCCCCCWLANPWPPACCLVRVPFVQTGFSNPPRYMLLAR